MLPSAVSQKTSWPPSHWLKSKLLGISTSTYQAGKPPMVAGCGLLATGAILEFE